MLHFFSKLPYNGLSNQFRNLKNISEIPDALSAAQNNVLMIIFLFLTADQSQRWGDIHLRYSNSGVKVNWICRHMLLILWHESQLQRTDQGNACALCSYSQSHPNVYRIVWRDLQFLVISLRKAWQTFNNRSINNSPGIRFQS